MFFLFRIQNVCSMMVLFLQIQVHNAVLYFFRQYFFTAIKLNAYCNKASREILLKLARLKTKNRLVCHNGSELFLKNNLVPLKFKVKATKFCEIFPLVLTVCTLVKSKGKISQNFVAFSEYMNFTTSSYQCVNALSRKCEYGVLEITSDTKVLLSHESQTSDLTKDFAFC